MVNADMYKFLPLGRRHKRNHGKEEEKFMAHRGGAPEEESQALGSRL